MKKGFDMADLYDEIAQVELQLRVGIRQERDAVYSALTKHSEHCLSGSLARYILEQAEWPVDEFLRAYEAGELDG